MPRPADDPAAGKAKRPAAAEGAAESGAGEGSAAKGYSRAELNGMSTERLRGLLRDRGLKVSGKKEELVDRLAS